MSIDSLFVYLNAVNAKVPLERANGEYSLYSYENVNIPAGMMRVVSTGITIIVPDGHHASFKASYVTVSRGLIVVDSALSRPEYTIDKDARHPQVDIFLYNVSRFDQTIRAGDEIASLILHRTSLLPVRLTENLQETRLVHQPVRIPQTAYMWLIHEYRNDSNSTINRFMSTTTQAMFNNLKESEAYQRARNRAVFEEQHLWKTLTADERLVVTAEYNTWKSNHIGSEPVVLNNRPTRRADAGDSDDDSGNSSDEELPPLLDININDDDSDNDDRLVSHRHTVPSTNIYEEPSDSDD
jgi:dUTPase